MSVPRPNWDPPAPFPASECVAPPQNQREGGTHSPAGEGVGGGSQFGRVEKKPILCLLCAGPMFLPSCSLSLFLSSCSLVCSFHLVPSLYSCRLVLCHCSWHLAILFLVTGLVTMFPSVPLSLPADPCLYILVLVLIIFFRCLGLSRWDCPVFFYQVPSLTFSFAADLVFFYLILRSLSSQCCARPCHIVHMSTKKSGNF